MRHLPPPGPRGAPGKVGASGGPQEPGCNAAQRQAGGKGLESRPICVRLLLPIGGHTLPSPPPWDSLALSYSSAHAAACDTAKAAHDLSEPGLPTSPKGYLGL